MGDEGARTIGWRARGGQLTGAWVMEPSAIVSSTAPGSGPSGRAEGAASPGHQPEALPPRPAQSEHPVREPGRPDADEAGAWFLVDNGGALAFRSAPDMDRKTTAIARPRELVYAAAQPPEHEGWIRTRENLWLPKQFLMPLSEVSPHHLHAVVTDVGRLRKSAVCG